MQRIGKITTQEGRKLQVNKVKRFLLILKILAIIYLFETMTWIPNANPLCSGSFLRTR